ncbi:cytosolic non-specific dipeptidase-like isoform X1 [Lepisosteus oculatus]|uniref:cytosolic non-specific dipeptidase-like isoform X1 n=2 Tax=Lepisosteus oculatus TaxID=7918 RepID=UPI00073FD45D|nr:PREDICTED: cytosolic non-specific dipeptidase-like isoform X1 [Lepisosteus oculatus]
MCFVLLQKTKFLFYMFMMQMACEVTPSVLDPLFQYIDGNQDKYVQRLKKWVAIESESSNSQSWKEVEKMLNVTAGQIRDLGGSVELASVGSQEMPSGESIPLPPVILAEFKKDPTKPTLCVYGHVDVQPAKKEDGWVTDPYNLTEVNGNLYGRGATDNKGPVLAWLHAVETYQALKQEIPVNIKFIIEGMEEVGSDGLETLIRQRNESFFSDVDYIVISDNVWVSRKPALTYGTRGNCYFCVEVEGPKLDLHSGVFGGSVHEPMTDLIALLGSLIEPSGRILIPGINEAVASLTEEEKKLYKGIEFDLEEQKKDMGIPRFLHDSKEEILMSRWRYPSLSIHGIEGDFSDPGLKTVIPRKVIGKFSIRQVPNMDPPVVERQVKEYLQGIFDKHKSPNKLKITMIVGARPWVADLMDPQYVAGRRAIKTVFRVDPDMIREGSTIPIAQTFQEVTGKSVMMLPIGGNDDAEHSQNEKISRFNYIQGTKLFAAYFYELSQLKH